MTFVTPSILAAFLAMELFPLRIDEFQNRLVIVCLPLKLPANRTVILFDNFFAAPMVCKVELINFLLSCSATTKTCEFPVEKNLRELVD